MANEYKLSYTASDINARLGKIDNLAEKSELPKNTSDLINDSDFVTKYYVQDYAQPFGDYALNSEVAQIKQQAVSESNAYADNADTGILAQAKSYANNAIVSKVGVVPEGSTVMDIIKNIQENTYDDSALVDRMDGIDGKVDALIGDDTNKSVRTIANEELAKQLVAEDAKESLDTLAEIATWIQSHPNDASAMNKAIEDLEAFVGVLPEDVTAATIVGYIQEIVDALENSFAEVTDEEIDTMFA